MATFYDSLDIFNVYPFFAKHKSKSADKEIASFSWNMLFLKKKFMFSLSFSLPLLPVMLFYRL